MNTRISLVFALSLVLATGCMKKGGSADNAGGMSTADSMKAAYTAMSAAFDAGKVDELDKYVATNFIENNLMSGMEAGLAGQKKFCAGIHAAFPDAKTTINDMRVDSNVLVARFSVTATNSGPMMGMPPTNKKMTNIMGIDEFRWENGKFAEHWGLFDEKAMMMQLGMMPPPPAGDAKMDDKKK